ncbi:ATP-binding protein [Rhodoferax mekongensis]|uniref:histidine kinase n=1 Tax=Rhodoferax mekongensis TaxID=3068341 RepID=A0ABZ0AYI1_9BURK|nr:ATP-binding protein [Rhodoferax sp. TBRC 17307]WNO04539.1 ATP-binding protein [Rhodoferax sp. TBRC 17307]
MLKPTPMHLRRIWLLLATVLSVAIVGFLIVQASNELRDARKRQAEFTESFVPSVFQLEREYLRFAHQVELASHEHGTPNTDALSMALDLVLSRLEVVDKSLAATEFRKTDAYVMAHAELQRVLQQADAAVGKVPQSAQVWAALYKELQALAPAMNALTMRSSLMMSNQQEVALGRSVDSAVAKLRLMAGLLVLLLVSAAVIGVRQGRVERERLRLEQLHEQMRAANEKADAANAGKSQFLANMSHELRTPLNGMLGMLSLLEATPVNAQQDDYIQTANRSAKHLLSLLNDILDASALEAGKMTLKPESVHLPSLVSDVQALMRPVALEKRLVLSVKADKDLPRWVMADGTRVKQIMLNLVSNALKFSEHGTVLVEVFSPSVDGLKIGDDVAVKIRVTDEGMGMSADVLAKLFQRFEQGNASSARRHGGTGLGLEISRNLARRMGGDIEVSSVEGKGSVFTAILCLPLSNPPSEQTTDAVTARREPGTPGLNLVVAEDNAINRKYMSALLGNMGHSVRFAEHGGIALQEIQREMPDLVLMDLHMPEVDGLQATEAIRQLPAPFCELPIIALTADVFEESKDRVTAAGMDGFLSKPVNVHELEKLLVRRFGLRGASLAMPAAKAAAKVQPAAAAAPAAAPQAADIATPMQAEASSTASAPVAEEAVPAPAPAPRQPRRRFRPGDVAEHLNMAMIGELCVGVTLQGYQSLLDGAMRTDAHCYSDLLAALEQNNTGDLLELGHSFKGVTASLGLAALSRLALTIEKQGHGFSADECKQHAESLRECWNTTHAICARMGLIVSS